ncbi:methyl-accepting chemotaxis protein [Peribacillus sp. Hz7]|uniref:methyl-accepting chemotaxis protein n=1 Tax=Peribacillus sp. Hz7 TaxID=3344873 RepID=UPI0035CAA1DB
METKLQQLLDNAEVIQASYPEDACLLLINHEKVLCYLPGTSIDLNIQVGAPISTLQGTVTLQALQSGQFEQEEKDSRKFGVPYISTASPIKENGRVIGALSSIVSNRRIDMLRSEAEELTAISQELAATTEHMASVSNVIAKDLQELADESSLLKNEIRTIEHVLSKIKDTAIKSRILGLNASIEAARSGEHGRGFMVVANEIKKMADSSKDAVEGFEPQLKEMMKNMEKAIETIQQISAHSEEQSVIVEEFHQSFDHIVHTASELSKNANL